MVCSAGGIVPNRDEVPKKRPVYGKKKTQKDAQQKGRCEAAVYIR